MCGLGRELGCGLGITGLLTVLNVLGFEVAKYQLSSICSAVETATGDIRRLGARGRRRGGTAGCGSRRRMGNWCPIVVERE